MDKHRASKVLFLSVFLLLQYSLFAENLGYERKEVIIEKLNSYKDMSFVPMWSNSNAFAWYSPSASVILIFYKNKSDSDASYQEKSGMQSPVFLVSGIVGISHSMRGVKISERLRLILTGEAGH